MGLYKTTSDLIGAKYKLGSLNPPSGVDCFTLVINYMRNCGIDIPDNEEFGGHNFKTYADAYRKDNDSLIRLGIEYIKTKSKRVELHKLVAGDIVLLKTKENLLVFGIDVGNGNVLVVSDADGVVPINKNYFTVLDAYRCQV